LLIFVSSFAAAVCIVVVVLTITIRRLRTPRLKRLWWEDVVTRQELMSDWLGSRLARWSCGQTACISSGKTTVWFWEVLCSGSTVLLSFGMTSGNPVACNCKECPRGTTAL
jgi:hypothetical protein